MAGSSVASKRAKPKRKAAKRPRVKKLPRTVVPLSRTEVVASVRREPLGHLLVEKMLRHAGFIGSIRSDKETLDAYSTDESIFSIRPQIVIEPKTPRDVEIAVTVLGTETKRFPALSLTPRAAGTGLSGGSLTDSVVIDVCTHLTALGAVMQNGETVTITCEPGVLWRDIEAKLATKGYYLPCYPASKDICSIGGAVANNAAGPDSLRFGHVADWVESLDVVLHDGSTYTIRPLTYREFQALVAEDHAYARIAKSVCEQIEANEATIKRAQPKTSKNSAGYALWNVLDGVSMKEWKRGIGTFDLTRLITGSQGTLGIITQITMRAEPIKKETSLIVVPVFDLRHAGEVIREALTHNPINIEVFDDLTFELALKNPQFFRARLSGVSYYKTMFALYTAYHVRYRQKVPPFTLLITVDRERLSDERLGAIVAGLRKTPASLARLVTNPYEIEMFWQVRRASYLLSKHLDPNKRPAAFLEDMVVPPQNLAKFFLEIKRLLKKYNVTAAVHGHGGDGHFHFYPLLDFTRKTTPKLILKMADEFFAVAEKFDGNLCGEHNDGIIRTPYLSKMFSKNALALFAELEHIFDPDDIFNPGKKVNPRFDIKDSIRTTN